MDMIGTLISPVFDYIVSLLENFGNYSSGGYPKSVMQNILMNDTLTTTPPIFTLLEGTWTGEGRGADFREYNYRKRYAMTELEKTIMTEISTLPETRLPDVLAFIRYLKLSIPKEQKELEERFDEAIKSIRARAEEMNITDADIEAEIRAVREGK